MTKQLAEIGKLYRTSFVPQLRSIDEKARTIEFVASTEAVDRYGDVIRVAGWKLESYRANPVFLWAHKSGEPPIGKCVDVRTESSPPALVQKIEFADAATYKFADTIFQLYKGKFLNAVSVGFMPLEQPNTIRDEKNDYATGYEFTSQELLELSAVPIPANPEAVARMVTKGFAEADLARVFTPMTEADAFRELAEVNHLVAKIAVTLAKTALLKADELRALLEAARLNNVSLTADLTLEELLAAIRGSGEVAEDALEVETSGEIESIEQLGAAIGTPDKEPDLYEVLSDSRSLRTGKFQFRLRSELR